MRRRGERVTITTGKYAGHKGTVKSNMYQRTTDYPAKKGPLCPWCSYQEMCPEWQDEKPQASPQYPRGRPERVRPANTPVPGTEEAAAATLSEDAPGNAGSSEGSSATDPTGSAVAARGQSPLAAEASETSEPDKSAATPAVPKKKSGRSRDDTVQLPLF